MKKTFGLIIQGPLLSKGRAGNQTHVFKTDLEKQGGFVDYDCRENIRKIIADFGNLFDSIVVSTWESDVRPNDQFEGATLVLSPDPGDIIRASYTPRSRNKHRQFISMQAGLRALETSKPDIVIKMRTDQYLDLKGLIDAYKTRCTHSKDPDQIIGVPLLRPDNYLTHDLYFIAPLEVLKKFCDAMLAFNRFEFIWCVHRDMVLKHAYVNYRNTIGVPDWAYFPIWPSLGSSRETKKIFAFMYERIFIPMGATVYETVVARGSLQSAEHIAEYAYPPNAEAAALKNIFNIPGFASTQWLRFFSFQEEVYGKKTTLSNRIKIVSGKITWDIFQVARKISEKLNITTPLKKIYRKIITS